MERGFVSEKIKTHRPADPVLVGLTLLMAGVGIAVLFSASYGYAIRAFEDPYYFLKRQLLFLGPSLIVCMVFAKVNLGLLQRNVKIVTLICLIVLLLPFIPGIGMTKNGATRWIQIFGNSFQPSELAKLGLIVYLSAIFAKKEDRLDDTVNSVIPPLLVTGLFAGVSVLQNDFSTAMLTALTALCVFWVARVRFRVFLSLALILVPVALLMILTSEYRLERVIAFLSPAYDTSGASFQINNSVAAIQEGGVWGLGIGQGLRKMASIPYVHNDFVFSAYIEETGLFGLLAYIGLLGAFCQRAFSAAIRQVDSFKRLLAFGSACAIVLQSLVNIAVAAGMIPSTGIPLPFFSQGGTSLLITCVFCGILINVSRREGAEREAVYV